MDITYYIIVLIVLTIFGIILVLLPLYIAFPIAIITAVSGSLLQYTRYKKRDKLKEE